jgi:hypothetical protein
MMMLAGCEVATQAVTFCCLKCSVVGKAEGSEL